jgi:hypothetical protein
MEQYRDYAVEKKEEEDLAAAFVSTFVAELGEEVDGNWGAIQGVNFHHRLHHLHHHPDLVD